MSRTHFWSFLQDKTGLPIESATISIFLAGTEEPANIYTHEFGGSAVKTTPQLKTNSLGYFEFWIADSSDTKAGYQNSQKFKIVGNRTGIADIMIDYIDILSSILPVDPTSDDKTANKAVSNSMAKTWNSLLIYQGMPIGRPGDSTINSDEMNKFVSNNLIARWQDHRKMNFNKNISFLDISTESALLPWEDKEHYPTLFGAHGILEVQTNGTDRSDTIKNRLVSNALANAWDEHSKYSFWQHDISAPDFNEASAHDLKRVNFSIPPFNLADPNAPHELVKEYNQYNKLVSNRLIRELMYDSEIKVSLISRKISSTDWQQSNYEKNIWVYYLAHNLNTKFIGLECFRKIERINPETGALEFIDNIFSPEDIFITSENTIEIHSSRHDECYVTVWGRKDLEKAMNEDSAVGGGSGNTNKFRILLKTNMQNAKVQISGDISLTWMNIDSEIYLKPGDYTLTFSDEPGYITPEPLLITVAYNKLINIIYEPQKYTLSCISNVPGLIRIIDPAGIINDSWVSSSDNIELADGTYIIQFNDIEGFKTPPSCSITINRSPHTLNINYEAIQQYRIIFNFLNNSTNSATLEMLDSTNTTKNIIIYPDLITTWNAATYELKTLTAIINDMPQNAVCKINSVECTLPYTLELNKDMTIEIVDWK